MVEPWRIELLGGLRASQGERIVNRFRTQKFGALLAYLAYYHHRAHPRDTLIDMLWPDCASEVGRDRLSTALSSLRHQLEPPGVPMGAVIVADRFNVGINPASITTDVSEFEALLDSVSDSAGTAERLDVFAEAIDLYHGELLPGYYEEWVSPERERLGERFIAALRRVVRALSRQRALDRALDYGWRAVNADPLREESHRDVIRILLATNQVSTAARQYRELERILETELGEKPSSATRALQKEIESRITAEGGRMDSTSPGDVSAPDRTTNAPQATSVSKSAKPALPSGTVTFLLTDIEGSTAQWQRSSGFFKQALAIHHALLRDVFGQYGGHEIKEAGDSFIIAFERAADALYCAIATQQALGQSEWPPETGPLKVRMALHTGDVDRNEGDYRSLILHYASRMLLAAHGGQILCSQATAELLRRSLDSGLRLADLGVYRLRDVPGVERLFQAEYPEMARREFPPLNAVAGYASSLPLSFTRFFGRESEIARLVEMVSGFVVSGEQSSEGPPLTTHHSRLVTLTGPGGTGKTRLSLEAASRLVEPYAGAVWYVPLADLSDAGLIGGAILDAMRLPRAPHLEPLQQAGESLSRQPSLLVLDNFEQLVEDGAPVIRGLLERAPSLACLITSRQLLGLTGEQECAVSPLPVPPSAASPEDMSLIASVQLFTDRAQAVRPDFQVTAGNSQAVAELCERLEGIPLAIELAAARAQVLTPAQMLGQLEHRFDFLVSRKRDAEARHRTLRSAVEWSYRLLSPELQQFFARLSVFRDGWSLEAADAVCEEPLALDCLAQLRECSLVLTDDSGPAMRFRMLDSLREYAVEQLPPEERTALNCRHAEYFLALAEEAEPHLTAANQSQWLERLETEHGNLRSALSWCKTEPAEANNGHRLASALLWFWYFRGHVSEGFERLQAILSRRSEDEAPEDRARALNAGSWLACNASAYELAVQLAEEALALSREAGYQSGIGWSLCNLGTTIVWRGDIQAGTALLEQSLEQFRKLHDSHSTATALSSLGVAAVLGGDHSRGATLFRESLAIHQQRGDGLNISGLLNNLGETARYQERYEEASACYRQALGALRETGDTMHIALCLEGLACCSSVEGHAARAACLFGASQSLRGSAGVPVPAAERADYDSNVAAARAALDEPAFDAAWESGRRLTWQQAVAYALEEDE